jgi:hypothetical protein
MPSLLDVLGWSDQVEGVGRSIFGRGPIRSAISAQVNLPNPSEKWAVVTRDAKSILKGRPGSAVQIIELRDEADRRVKFENDAARWQENFLAVLRFKDLVSGQAH